MGFFIKAPVEGPWLGIESGRARGSFTVTTRRCRRMSIRASATNGEAMGEIDLGA